MSPLSTHSTDLRPSLFIQHPKQPPQAIRELIHRAFEVSLSLQGTQVEIPPSAAMIIAVAADGLWEPLLCQILSGEFYSSAVSFGPVSQKQLANGTLQQSSMKTHLEEM